MKQTKTRDVKRVNVEITYPNGNVEQQSIEEGRVDAVLRQDGKRGLSVKVMKAAPKKAAEPKEEKKTVKKTKKTEE
jgi:acetolactate synthase regulatory subunit